MHIHPSETVPPQSDYHGQKPHKTVVQFYDYFCIFHDLFRSGPCNAARAMLTAPQLKEVSANMYSFLIILIPLVGGYIARG